MYGFLVIVVRTWSTLHNNVSILLQKAARSTGWSTSGVTGTGGGETRDSRPSARRPTPSPRPCAWPAVIPSGSISQPCRAPGSAAVETHSGVSKKPPPPLPLLLCAHRRACARKFLTGTLLFCLAPN